MLFIRCHEFELFRNIIFKKSTEPGKRNVKGRLLLSIYSIGLLGSTGLEIWQLNTIEDNLCMNNECIHFFL